MTTAPSVEALAFARTSLDRRHARAMEVLLTGEHLEVVAGIVFTYVGEDCEVAPSAGEVANQILAYIATVIEPLIVEPQR